MLCLLEPLRSASGYGIFQRLPMASSDQNSLRTPLPGYCLVTLTDAPASLIGAQWKVLGPELGDPGSGCSSVPSVASTAPSPGSSSVLSSKTGRLTRAQADLKGLPVFSSLNLIDHPAPSPKAGPPISPAGPVQPVCGGWPSGKRLPRDMEGA